jgi:hypothetical protein
MSSLKQFNRLTGKQMSQIIKENNKVFGPNGEDFTRKLNTLISKEWDKIIKPFKR